jgi:hypothetical protein
LHQKRKPIFQIGFLTCTCGGLQVSTADVLDGFYRRYCESADLAMAAGPVTGTEPGAIVAVEIFMEEDMI